MIFTIPTKIGLRCLPNNYEKILSCTPHRNKYQHYSVVRPTINYAYIQRVVRSEQFEKRSSLGQTTSLHQTALTYLNCNSRTQDRQTDKVRLIAIMKGRFISSSRGYTLPYITPHLIYTQVL